MDLHNKMIYMKQLGFTLIETLIVIVIIGILSAIGMSSYKTHIDKQHRVGAIIQMENLASYLVDYKNKNTSYPTIDIKTADSIAKDFLTYKDGKDVLYNITPTTTDTTYSITATPAGKMKDDECRSLILTDTNKKTISNKIGENGGNGTAATDTENKKCWAGM